MKENKDMADILMYHLKRYPQMEATDCVKLLYQREFGCGHFAPDPTTVKKRLDDEFASVNEDDCHTHIEPVGNGFVRVHLGAILNGGISRDALADAFIASSHRVCGSTENLLEGLDAVRLICYRGHTSFSMDELEKYIAKYKAAGCPPVHHSEKYRSQYCPAYRVVLMQTVEPLLTKLSELERRLALS